MVISALQGSMNWPTFRDALMGATRLYCMIAMILAGAALIWARFVPAFAPMLAQLGFEPAEGAAPAEGASAPVENAGG